MESIYRKIIISGIFCLGTINLLAQPSYNIRETGDFSTFDGHVLAKALNDSGAVAMMTITGIGYSPQYAGYLLKDEELTNLNLSLTRFPTSVNDINNNYEICGVVADQSVQYFESAFVHKNGKENILTPPQVEDLENRGERALAINDNGTVVGYYKLLYDNGSIEEKACIWENGEGKDLGIESIKSHAYDINNNKQIVGYFMRKVDNNYPYHEPYLWDNGNFIELGTLGGNVGIANAINDHGQIVGVSMPSGGEYMDDQRAFIWENEEMISLGTLEEGIYSEAKAINNQGDVVGFIGLNDEQYSAFLWQRDKMYDLNDLIDPESGWRLIEATDINDRGQITGIGILNGERRGFILDPIRYPVLVVPGIAGTYAADIDNDIDWIMKRGADPSEIQVDPIAGVYDDLITTLQNVGYEKDKDLFIVNYDWRVNPAPIDGTLDGNIDGLSGLGISDDFYGYGVDYLGWYLKKASEKWREENGTELKKVDIITHSTGGLVTRAYIESDAYGDLYDVGNDYALPTINNFIMIGVPNRGASKAWNPLQDNWIADPAYQLVLSKILLRGYQMIKRGMTITGPDFNISENSIKNENGELEKTTFIRQYVPTIQGLLATYEFLDLGDQITHLNDDEELRNNLILDLNNGYDLYPSDPNQFVEKVKLHVIYGAGQSTKDMVELRSDAEEDVLFSFSNYLAEDSQNGEIWYRDYISNTMNGDGTVPVISSAGQFIDDERVNIYEFPEGDHTGLVSKKEVQEIILDIFGVDWDDEDIETNYVTNLEDVSLPTIYSVLSQVEVDVLSIVVDPVEMVLTDSIGNRLGYTRSTGALVEMPGSAWFGNTDGMGYFLGDLVPPLNLELTGLDDDYYIMVSAQKDGESAGVVLEGYLAKDEKVNYEIDFDSEVLRITDEESHSGFLWHGMFPNPVKSRAQVYFEIYEKSSVQITLLSSKGQHVNTLTDNVFETGKHHLTMDLSHLPQGMYFIHVNAGSIYSGNQYSTQQKLIVVD